MNIKTILSQVQAGKGASFQTCCAMGVGGKALLALGKLLTGVQVKHEEELNS